MTLEDFFTLTEMKDGLTTPTRVQELVTAMKERDNVVKNVGDITRQWSAVASTIAATESKDCLDLFVQLDGLSFINRWLKDAQTFGSEESACFVEEAISALLHAVENLQIDDQRLVSSGVCITVKALLGYKSPKVQSKARALFDSWKLKNVDTESMDVEDAEKIIEHPESEFICNDASLARLPVDQKSNGTTEGEIVKLNNNDQESSHLTSGHADIKDERPDSVASPVKLDSDAKESSVKEDVLCSPDGNVDLQISAVPKQSIEDVVSEKCEETKDDNKVGNLPDKVDKVEEADGTAVDEAVTHPNASTYEKCERVPVKTPSLDDTSRSAVKSTNESIMDDVGNDDDGSLEPKGLDQGTGSVLVETKDQETTESSLKEVSVDDEVKRQQKNKKKRFGKRNKFAKLTKNSKNTDFISQTANKDIEDITFDALEVACLVANEVAREVVNYEEQSDSSSASSDSSSSSSSLERISTSKSVGGDEEQEINGPLIMCVTMGDVSHEASEKAPLNSSAIAETNPENLQDMESSQLTAEARESGHKTGNCFLEFDLNQELTSEECLDQNPVSVVSASRAVAGPGMQTGPLKFEGSLGWKGSAATSAFRPASPRRTSDSDRAFSSGAASSGSRQRQEFLDIDLNVASGDDKVANHTSGTQKQILPVLTTGESSLELGSRQSERLKFDLNQMEDDGHAPSPASSSSCIQPPTRNFDLNDNPSYGNDPSNIHPFLWGSSSNTKANPYVGGHQEDSVISILGTKVKKSTFPPQTSFPFQNGRVSDPFIDANLLRGGPLPLMGLGPAIPYPQSVYGYNGIPMGPGIPFSSAPVYGPGGPIPYMFDTRGAPFTPQLIGAPSAVPSSYCQPSLVMNMMGATPAPNVDMSSGYPLDVGNRDPTFFQQLFIPGQGRQLNDGFRPLSSGASGGKRKEPETGWDLFPTNYKHHQPPHL